MLRFLAKSANHVGQGFRASFFEIGAFFFIAFRLQALYEGGQDNIGWNIGVVQGCYFQLYFLEWHKAGFNDLHLGGGAGFGEFLLVKFQGA